MRVGIVLVGAALALGCGEPTGTGPDMAVEILNPVVGAPAYDTDTLLLLGTVTSRAIGILPDDSLWWTDNGDVLGSGPRIAIRPDQGTHRFVLRARYGTAEDSAVRTVTVLDGVGRVLWTVPLDGARGDGLAVLTGGQIVARSGSRGIVVIAPDGSVIDQYELAFVLADASPTTLADGGVLLGDWSGGVFRWTPGGSLDWRFDIGTEGRGFHHVHGGVAVGPGGTVYFLSAEGERPVWSLTSTGDLRWRSDVYPVDPPPGESLGFAVLVGDSLVVVSLPEGVAAVAVADGAVRWVQEGFGSAYGRIMPAVSACGTVYVGAFDPGTPPPRQPVLAAFAPNGAVEWRVPVHGVPSAPIVGSSHVYAGWGDGSVLAIATDGIVVDTIGGVPTDSAPEGVTLGAGRVLYVAGGDSLYSYTAAGGRRFATPLKNDPGLFVRPGPVIAADGTLYVRTTEGVMAIRDTVGPSTDAPWSTSQGNFQRTGRVAVSNCAR